MPLGIVSDADFELELESFRTPSKEVTRAQIIDQPSKGRKDGDVNVPDALRQIIGEEAVINGRPAALDLARNFGISASSVSAYANGATSTKSYDTPSKSIIQHINKSRARAVKKAARVMGAALGAITQEKLDYADATDLSGIAKDMSVIIKNLEPQSVPSEDSNKTQQFVIYAPSFRDERSYEVVNVIE